MKSSKLAWRCDYVFHQYLRAKVGERARSGKIPSLSLSLSALCSPIYLSVYFITGVIEHPARIYARVRFNITKKCPPRPSQTNKKLSPTRVNMIALAKSARLSTVLKLTFIISIVIIIIKRNNNDNAIILKREKPCGPLNT